jgi:hypothetical protein
MAPQVGGASDGAYNSKLGVYLLPPLIGLPYDDMVANGMLSPTLHFSVHSTEQSANKFICYCVGLGASHAAAGDKKYGKLIAVHGAFAALAFLLFIPSAFICARFFYHGRNPRMAMHGHIGLNVASILCLTITFVAGYVAVGQKNWGTNPHHVSLSSYLKLHFSD